MKNGEIGIDSKFGKSIGFTSDKFHSDSYLWVEGKTIIISFIESLRPGNGDFRRLIENIRKEYAVEVPTPFLKMRSILERNGYKARRRKFRGMAIEVFRLEKAGYNGHRERKQELAQGNP
jgi:hypothetical protein